MSIKERFRKSVRQIVIRKAVAGKRTLARRRQLFEQLEDRKMLAGLLTYGDEDLLGFNGYTLDPKTGAILSGLPANIISDSSVQTTHAFPFVGNLSDYPGTDQIYVGSNQTGSRDDYSTSSDRKDGPQSITMNYASLVPQGGTIDSLTLGIAADDFQFDRFAQPFIAKINGITNNALTTKLNSLRQTGPLTQFFTIGIDPAQLTPDHVLTLSIDNTGDGGDGWAIDFLTIGIPQYEVYESSVKLTDSQSVISLGAAGLGEIVADKTFTVRNISNSPLTLQTITLPDGFVLTSGFTAGQVVAAGGTTTFSVAVDSTKAGDHQGTLVLAASDQGNPTFEFKLVGSVATNKGTEFWLAFQPNHPSIRTPNLSLFIAGDVETTGTLSIPGVSYSTPFSVTPGTVTQVALPEAIMRQIIPVQSPAIGNANDKITATGIHVTSIAPVAVYGLNRAAATTDGFLGLPINILGTEYIALSYGATFSTSHAQQISVVGISDNTEVMITPTATVGSRTKGVPYSVSLNAGQVYFLINTSTSDELTGSIIEASRPIAVFSGHTSAQVPTGRTAADHLTEQLPPTNSWASRFMTVPLGDQDQNLYRVLASEDQTTIRINGTFVTTIDRGQVYTFERTTAALIETSRPALVAQFARGGNGGNSDPFMQIVPAIDQYSASYTLATPTDTAFNRHWANLVVPSDNAGTILRNGIPVPASSFTAISGTSFSFAKLLLPRGTHQFDSPGVPFGVTLYGWGDDDSYGYLGGQVFRQADIEVSVDDIELASGAGSVNFGSVLVGTSAQKTFTIRNGTSIGELNLGQISIPNDFTLISGPGDTVLGPNETTTFVIGINTSSLGSRSGELTIENDDLDESPFRISLQGSIDTPVIEIFDGTSPVSNSNGSIDIGSTQLSQPITRTFTIRNSGTFELSMGTIVIPGNSGFSITRNPAATVSANGGQTTFQIQLDASTIGNRRATVSVPNNDPTKNPFTFDVTGFVYDDVDLVVTNIQTSPTSIVGGQVDVTWTIRNQGAGEFRGTFSDSVSISSDTQIGGDRLLGAFTFDGTLIAGQSETRTQRITLPTDLVGLKHFVVRTDDANQVSESGSTDAETNNVAIDDQVLNILAADLQSFDVEVAPVLPTGTSTRVSWKVRNIGNAATLTGATWQDEVFLSTDKLLDGNDLRLARIDNPSSLSESGSGTDRYASFADVAIPYGTFGVRYVIVRSDSGTSVVELDESNNVASSPATNVTWQPPDLRVENVISQAFAFTGAPTRVSWDVHNVGRTAMLPSEGTWRDRVYLSTDTTLNTQQDVALGEFTHTGLLLPGEGYTQTVDLMMPEASVRPAGDYYLIVETDWRNEVKEGLFDGNNWTSETSITRVINAAPPDLVVDSIGSIPATIFAGQTLDVAFQVRNAGAGDTEPTNTRWSDAVYLSTNDTLDASDRLLGRIARNGGLKKDDPPYSQSASFRIPSDLVGDHRLIVVTNVFGQVFGDDVSNNQGVTTSSINIQTPPADLDVIAVTPAATVIVVGSPLTVDFTIRNVGPQATTVSNWTDRVYLSQDTILDANDLLFDEMVRTGTLAAGAEYQGTATKSVDQVGSFYVLIQTDATDAVFEIVDGNNVQASSRQVNVVPTPADLTTSHLVVPSVARAGFETSISYRVSNTGPNPTLTSNWIDRFYLSSDETLDANDRMLKSVSRFGTLAASPEFYEVTTSIAVPDGLMGQYHVIVHADALNTVFEQDNVDNIAASTSKVTLVSEPADLIVTSINAPGESTVGQSFRVDWVVQNQGTGDTVVSSWRERVYLSDNNVFNPASDTLLREFVYTHIDSSVEGPLGAGKSINRSEVVSFADNVLGDKFLFVVVDPTNLVFEPGAQDNNVSTAQPIRRVQRDTDLQVFDVVAPTTATEGVAFDVSWTVRNVGTAATNAAFWYDEVYVSTDNVLSANDVRLGSVRRSNPLNGTGQSDNQYSVTGSFAIPIGVTPSAAPLFVLVKADGGTNSLVPERLEDNNVTAATSATTVSPGTVALLPDLSVTTVGLSSTSAQVGQPITVNWAVQNSGPGGIVNGSWFDSVYLSLDQILDRQNGTNQSRDIFLGTWEQKNRSLINDASYNESRTFTIPAGLSGDYFVLVAADIRNDIGEGTQESNNLGVGTTPLSIQPKDPADLVVGTITIPVTGISGQSATIAYTVANNGQNPAIGSWYDAIYISADTTWDVNDALFGRVLHNGDVQPLGTYSESLTATLPGVLPGNYHVIIRSDIRNQIAESNDQNNLRATLDTFALDVTELTSGVPIDTNIGLSESAFFKIIVPANRTLGLSVDSASNTADTQLYVSKGTLPTQSRFDFSSNHAGRADHFLLVPDTEEATYFVLVKRIGSPGATPKVTVQADLIGFSLLSTDVSRVGNAGSVTIAITGAQLRGTQSVSLVGASTAVTRDASRFLVVDSSLVYATFDLTGMTVGSYSLTAANDSAETATLETAINVEAARGGPAKLALAAPNNVRPGQTFQATLTVYNDGNVDVPAPLLQIDSNSALLLGYTADDLHNRPLSAIIIPQGGFRDSLRPGQSVHVSFIGKELTGNTGTAEIEIRSLGDSYQSLELPPLFSDDEYRQQFGARGDLLKLLMDSYASAPANEVVRQIGSAASLNLPSEVEHVDLRYARSNQLATAINLMEFSEFNGSISSNGSQFSQGRGIHPYHIGTSGKSHYIVPGFLAADPPADWVYRMANALREICPEDSIYIVSWDSGTRLELAADIALAAATDLIRGFPSNINAVRAGLGIVKSGATALAGYYASAAARTRDVGLEIARHIQDNSGSAASAAIYGHSLGAHIAGFAGAATSGALGKIVGLDPAGPGFGLLGPDSRLDPTDAQHVESINTSPILGRYCDSGHVNYYPEVSTIGSHSFAYEAYTSALENRPKNGDKSSQNFDEDFLGKPKSLSCANSLSERIEQFEQRIKQLINIVRALDPNDIIGPSGFGPENWITTTQPLNYTIRFENDPVFATAPAQRIEITQTLDSDLDARSFRLGDFGFGELFVDVPENRSFYSQRIDLRETKGIFVDVFAGINVATSEAFWTFIAVDPATGDLPDDPLKGILPPNLTPPEGDGFVRYSVKAKAGVTTGTRIDAQARIVFDINEPIDTPPIFNTLDAVTPTSQVAPLDPLLVAEQARFPVQWSGSDDANGSAIGGYDIYVNVDDKGFQPWLTNVTFTEALYDGPVGSSYAFYSVARDNAGNSEAAPIVPDSSITVVAPRDVRIEIGERTIATPGEVVAFGEAIVGATGVERTFIVRNSGNEPLVLGSASFTEGAGFTIITNLPEGLTLAPNATATLVVSLDAAAIGNKTSTLQFATNVNGKSPFTLLLTGDVVPVPTLQMSIDNATISEDGGSAIVTVSRNTTTTSPLNVNLTSDIPSRLSFPNSITIPVGAVSASFLVRAIDNARVDDDSLVVISATANDMASDTITVSLIEDDVRGFIVSPINSSTTELGGTATFTVVLSSEPTGAVTIPLSSSDTSEGTVAPASLEFTAANWNIAQTVTVTGVNDEVDDDNIDFMILTGAATGGDYAGLEVDDVSITNIDDDTRGFTVSAISRSTTETGDSGTFTVVLSSQPTSDVTIPLSSSDLTEGTVAPSSLIFTAANWNVAQTVSVTGVDDDIDDGNVRFTILTAAALGGDYTGLDADDVQVRNIDNDTRGVSVSAISGATTEAGGTATFMVVLTSQPTGSVEIPLTSSDQNQGTVSPATLIFTATNWNVAQTVTVTGVNDDIDDGDVTFTILTGIATGGDYAGLAVDDVSVVNIDNNTRGIRVSAISGNTAERGGSATFTIVLDSQPTSDVTIPLSSSDLTEGTVSPGSLLFTSANWNVAQVVNVLGVDDHIVDGNVAYRVLIGEALGGDYAGLVTDDVSVTNVDVDRHGITISAVSGRSTESGGIATFTVVLDTMPSASVSIPLQSSDATEGSVAPASLIFTTANWNVPQLVTVTGVNDAIDDGDVAFTILIGAAAGGEYAGLDADDVRVTNIDDDTRGVTLSTISRNVTEAGGTATFTVVLNSQPTADVTIPLVSNDLTEGTIVPTNLSFTTTNWNVAQTVTVRGVNDQVDDGDVSFNIVTGIAVGGDYAGLNAADASVINVDDDTRGITVSEINGSTTEAGGSRTFTVVLDSQPTANVTIPLSSSDQTEGIVAPASLIFTAANWNLAQTVTVTGVNDNVDDGDVAYTILTGPATGGDYAGLVTTGVSVVNIDDDTRGITVSAISGITTESGGTATFTIVLKTQPTGNVTIPLSSRDTTEGVVTPTSIVFSPADWNNARTITVTGIDDNVADGGIVYRIATEPAMGGDYAGIDAPDVIVTNQDNETPMLSLSLVASSISENGGTTTGTVSRNTPTDAELRVILLSSNSSLVTVPLSMVIPAGLSSVTFDATAIDNQLFQGTSSITITARATGLTTATTTLEVVEDDLQWPWHNAENPVDVNGDGVVSPLDILHVVNFINAGHEVLPDPRPGELAPPPYVDVNNNGFVSPLDILLIVNYINRRTNEEGEGISRDSVDHSTFGDPNWLDELTTDLKKRQRRR